MKKKLLATGVAVALGALSGVASAALAVNATGVGSINVIPYYSVQGGNDTLLSIVNTDTVNGKAVKVRFRGAEWSDDVFDFQIFLSPGDVWTGGVTKNGNLAKMITNDSTCTLPENINQDFVPIRLQASKQNVGTLEGYVEIITMADIAPPAGANALWVESNPTGPTATAGVNTLYSVIKHPQNGKPACRTSTAAAAVLRGLVQDNYLVASSSADQLTWMNPPTPALTSYATIINVPTARAFTNVATAVTWTVAGVKQYFRQANELLPFEANLTADRIFAPVVSVANPTAGALNPTTTAAGVNDLGANVPMYQFDMPDLSTPHDTDYTTTLSTDYDGLPGIQLGTSQAALAQRDALAALLGKSGIISEYVTSDTIGASTDIVISQPIRRYFYEYRLADTSGNANNGHLTLNSSNQRFFVAGPSKTPNGATVAFAATPYGGLDGATNRIQVGAPTFFDREENTAVSSDDIVISPTPPTTVGTYSLMGEVSVISINNGGDTVTEALSASLTINDYTAPQQFRDGWVALSTVPATPAGQKLPVLGFTAINIVNMGVGSNGTNYGMSVPQRYIP